MSRAAIWVERLAIALASLALSLGLIALLSGFFAARDQPKVGAVSAPPGEAFKDLGDAHLTPGAARPVYDSDPPTSGPHFEAPVLQDSAQLSDDQLLEALARGDVVLVYGGPSPPPGLALLAQEIAPPFSPALAQAGQAVILASRPGMSGIVALAWAHLLRAGSSADPALRQFAEFWLGRGAGPS